MVFVWLASEPHAWLWLLLVLGWLGGYFRCWAGEGASRNQVLGIVVVPSDSDVATRFRDGLCFSCQVTVVDEENGRDRSRSPSLRNVRHDGGGMPKLGLGKVEEDEERTKSYYLRSKSGKA
ncbi:hypothetical protein Pint_22608 [Pistacia integerrima]|uniref:Uncharacterized protein n=1 Tax=Pistacia integerrima TaxID=434235 RepID=A0ACC0YMN3_9ROSI|nr:hypothetical protein Pint_22608 [Pistacia integerrima]